MLATVYGGTPACSFGLVVYINFLVLRCSSGSWHSVRKLAVVYSGEYKSRETPFFWVIFGIRQRNPTTYVVRHHPIE